MIFDTEAANPGAPALLGREPDAPAAPALPQQPIPDLYLVRTPEIIQRIFDGYTWRGRPGGGAATTDGVIDDPAAPTVYLTFDDGPIPGVTPWVLAELARYGARGTFFCVGENVERYPGLLDEVRAAGHAVGNHTHNHLDGWATDRDAYVRNVARCAEAVDSALFRPPYGRISPRKADALRRRDYEIVMWDVLSGDFDAELAPEQCLANVLDNVQPGSIVVFHDSLKAERNLRYVLPRALAALSARGYRFAAVGESSVLRPVARPAVRARREPAISA